jgi:hypothetical protein
VVIHTYQARNLLLIEGIHWRGPDTRVRVMMMMMMMVLVDG